MKRAIVYVALLVTLLCFAGCTTKKTPTAGAPAGPPTLPTNARDAADANAFRVIADAYAFLNSVRHSQMTLTATQKSLFNDVVLAYNSAYTIGMAYHTGTYSDSAGLISATNNLSTKLTAASTQIVVPTSKLRPAFGYESLGYEGGL